MRFAYAMVMLLILTLLPVNLALAKPEVILGVGPGFIPAARDADGETEGVDTYLDFGVRGNSHWSVGMRDRQPPSDRSLHELSGWLRIDLEDYRATDTVLYTRIMFGAVVVPMGSFKPDFTTSHWTVAGGYELKQSGLWSLFAEGEGAFGVGAEQITSIGLRVGALFRFGGDHL